MPITHLMIETVVMYMQCAHFYESTFRFWQRVDLWYFHWRELEEN